MVLQNKAMRTKMTVHDYKVHVAFYVVLAVLMVLGVISSIFSIMAFILFAAYVVLADSKNVYLSLFFLMPFANIFKISPSATSFFTIVEIVALAKLIVKAKKINVKFLISWMILVSYLVFGFNLNFTVLIKQAMILPLVYFFFDGDRPDIKRFTLNYANGLLLSSFIALFNDHIPNMSQYVVNDKAFELAGDVYRFSAFFSDPNYYTLGLILALCAILVLYANNIIGGIAYVYYCATACFGALTVSKSFILLFAFLSVFFVCALIRNKKYRITLYFAVFVAIIALLMFSGRIEIFNNILQRFTSDSSDMTTGRIAAWAKYGDYFGAHPLKLIFGSGISARYLGIAPHNTYIDFLYYYGIVGTVLFICPLVLIFTRKPFKKNVTNWFPIICVLIGFFFLSGLMYHDFVFSLIVPLFVLTYDFRDKEKRVDLK